MTSEPRPTVEQVFGMMRQTMGSVPSAMEKATAADDGLLYEHLRSRAYAMPPEAALDEETRTLFISRRPSLPAASQKRVGPLLPAKVAILSVTVCSGCSIGND